MIDWPQVGLSNSATSHTSWISVAQQLGKARSALKENWRLIHDREVVGYCRPFVRTVENKDCFQSRPLGITMWFHSRVFWLRLRIQSSFLLDCFYSYTWRCSRSVLCLFSVPYITVLSTNLLFCVVTLFCHALTFMSRGKCPAI